MSRQLKFRAWDNHEKKWLMGYEYTNLGGFSMFGECMLMGEWSSVVNRFILQQHDRKPEDLIVMQFTGMLDKNGKEIYEGDVLQMDKYNQGVITFRSGAFLYNEEPIGFGVDGWDTFISEVKEPYGVVIGNIYEHGDLLIKPKK